METVIEKPTRMGPAWNDIVSLAYNRSQDASPLIYQMREVRDRYNGDIVYPWSQQITGGKDMPALTPHLIGESIDNYGLRAASVMPQLHSPAVNPAVQTGPRSRAYARTRKRAMAATLGENKWSLLSRRFFRHLAGFATTSLLVEPDPYMGMPRIRIINPLNAFPDPRTADEYMAPTNCVYIFGHSPSWLRKRYPELAIENGGPIAERNPDNELWDLIYYVDEECMVIGLAGRRMAWENDIGRNGVSGGAMELKRTANLMGRFPGITMGRVTLDRLGSALQHTVGMVDWAARLQLLNVVATEKAIFPDTYILGDGQRTPKLHTEGGKWKDGRTGEVNVITDATQLGQLRQTPDPAGNVAIDRLERNARISMGLTAQMNGETNNAMRTGRGVEAIMNASVDPKVHELQEILTAWMPDLLKSVSACYTAYFPNKDFSLYSTLVGDEGEVEFNTTKHLEESDKFAVTYPIAGADLQLTNIALSQMQGSGAISRHSFRERHPWISDADAEGKRVVEEQLEDMAMQALQQQAVGGQVPLEQLAMIEEAWRKEKNPDIFTAIRAATEALKELQAKEAEEEVPEGMAMPTEQAPGFGGPTAPMAAVPPPEEAIGPTTGMEGLRELQNALAAGSRRVNGMTGP